jgi:hypothetical protein
MIFSIPNNSPLLAGNEYAAQPLDVDVVLGMTAGTFLGLQFDMAFVSIIYQTILLGSSRSKDGKNDNKNGRAGGWWKRTMRLLIRTMLVASSILLPYAIMTLFGIKNLASQIGICSSFVLYLFRMLKAAFGYIPPGTASRHELWGVRCLLRAAVRHVVQLRHW